MHSFKIPIPPKGMLFNNNKKIVKDVLDNLATKTNGICPSMYPKTLNMYKCPCIFSKINRECICKLFIKVENK